ncbi:MAG TPA: hypothetical protein DCL73_16550 [Treponema sp.]|nr:hypothetical protein [Treponema sp.]
MKSKSIFIYSFIIAFVFAAAVIFFCYSLGHEYANGSERTGYEFDTLVRDTSVALSSYDASSPEFNTLFNKACGNYEDYSFITLKNESALLYVYPDASVSAVQNVSRFCRVYSSSFTSNGISYVLTASLYLLRPASIFYYARFSFLIILAATVFSVILILYLHLSERPSDAGTGQEPEYYAPPVTGSGSGSESREEEQPAPDENEPFEEKIVSEDASISIEKPQTDTDVSSSAVPLQKVVPQVNPEGLFSPVTGFGWGQYLETRLDSELVRAASSEQDLSLFIIRIPALTFTDAVTLKICTYLLEQFQFKDMLFEYGTDGFAAIKENTAVDEAVSFADTLYTGISGILKESGTDLKCAVGISSRSVRMLQGSRLIQEAAEALEHAFREPDSPIIAFRANADKYRKFIETEAKNQGKTD